MGQPVGYSYNMKRTPEDHKHRLCIMQIKQAIERKQALPPLLGCLVVATSI